MKTYAQIAMALAFLLMWPVSGGYFYNRPVCLEAKGRGDCALVLALVWPVSLPAHIASRIFH